jgi:LPXTG-motif cell wall-anchored protein
MPRFILGIRVGANMWEALDLLACLFCGAYLGAIALIAGSALHAPRCDLHDVDCLARSTDITSDYVAYALAGGMLLGVLAYLLRKHRRRVS